ncbi:type II secretory pathway protein [Pandoraea pneumonica]|uniref:Type II secretory pathway protein n=1 Tax=Pandoraea pneumonica TaxID=2508299 RepID=A0A5E4RND8_9BURK|nr:type II secretory pathway protein [Pandoraea pneumonica]VVD64483.1 type II secretory pathway protein [Pandoraea pneumonica]
MKLLMPTATLLLSSLAFANEPYIVPAPIDYVGPALHDDGPPESRDIPSPPTSSRQKNQSSTRTNALPFQPGKFDFQFVNVAQLVSLLYGEAIKTPYVIAPDVLQDDRLVSLRYEGKPGDLRAFLTTLLESLGFGIERRRGVDFVFKLDPNGLASNSTKETIVYRPLFRDTAYLAGLVRPLFQGHFTVNRAVSMPAANRAKENAPEGSAAALIDAQGDTLLFQGTREEIIALCELLPQVDTPIGEVSVRATAYEVSRSNERGSAFQLALDLLSKGLGLSVSIAGDVVGNTLRIKTSNVDTIFSALSKDARFHVINSPNLRIRSGARGRLTVGQKVPVLKSVSYPRGGGEPVQSVEYHSSGVIFELRPMVKESVIDLHVSQQISDFVKTTTGVNASPTLNTREVSTEITLQNGEVILLGGLTTNKSTDNTAGISFLPRFLDAHSDTASSTEILLVLQVERVGASSVGSVGAPDTCLKRNSKPVPLRVPADKATPPTEQRVSPPTVIEGVAARAPALTAEQSGRGAALPRASAWGVDVLEEAR